MKLTHVLPGIAALLHHVPGYYDAGMCYPVQAAF